MPARCIEQRALIEEVCWNRGHLVCIDTRYMCMYVYVCRVHVRVCIYRYIVYQCDVRSAVTI